MLWYLRTWSHDQQRLDTYNLWGIFHRLPQIPLTGMGPSLCYHHPHLQKVGLGNLAKGIFLETGRGKIRIRVSLVLELCP